MTSHLLTRDRIARALEVETIAHHVRDGMAVLDVGCGDGETLCELARRFEIEAVGVDVAAAMIDRASPSATDAYWRGEFRYTARAPAFWVGDILHIVEWNSGHFDLAYTERCLINLPDWETQKRAAANIARCLKPGGLFIMLENSWDGLQAINDMRERVGLYRIEPPSHNRYLRDAEVEAFATDNGCGVVLEAIAEYSGTYYFLSRVVNAALAVAEGREPDYDSPINRLALSMPPIAGLRGQGRIWVFRKV